MAGADSFSSQEDQQIMEIATQNVIMLLAKYRRQHAEIIARLVGEGVAQKILLCQIFAGLGHIMNVVVGCLALALATQRALVLDHTHGADSVD